jgi:hypothetical protein
VAARKVDDAEAPESKPDSRPDKNAFIIWPTVNDGFIHAMDQILRNFRRPLVFKDSS